jgi:hypothetical protein
MKLTDFNPRWVSWSSCANQRLGMTFDCPHCRTQRIGVAFHHKGRELVEDQAIHAQNPDVKIWDMTGDGFEDMTLSPSIDTSAFGHWHGFITNGEIR